MKEKNNYSILFKATSLFGLVEVLKMLLKIISNKFASTYLGTYGVGLLGLIDNAAQLILSVTNFGINFIGVREVAALHGRDTDEFQKTVKIIYYFCFLTGVLAAIVSVILSPVLSDITFNTKAYTIWFVFLSLYFICNNIMQSRVILLEGTQSLKKLIFLNILASLSNTLIVIGCYYYYHINGIIAAMLITSFINMILFVGATRKMTAHKVNVSVHEVKVHFKRLIKSGGLLACNTFFGLLCFFLIRLFFKELPGQSDLLGFYQAGNVILNAYLGMIFIAMGKFFFPKLAQLSSHEKDSISLVNDQLELNLIVILPAILFILAFGNELITILFSAAFLPVFQILIFGLFSILLKGFNYAIGYLLLSHSNFKQYFYINLMSDLINLALTIILYQQFELLGIGIALVLNYLFSAVYMYFYVSSNYNFKLNSKNTRLLLLTFFICFLELIAYFNFNFFVFRLITFGIFIIILGYSLLKIDQYIFKQAFLNKLKSLF